MSGPREDLLGRCTAWFTEHGVGDTSLRTLADGVGTSHRMLLYHFGSRAGLLSAVVEAVEAEERALLATALATYADAGEAGRDFWTQVADRAVVFAPLYFELAGQAMQGAPYAAGLRTWLGEGWTEPLTSLWRALGRAPDEAVALARLNLAVVRGLLFEVALTGDRGAVDAAMVRFTELTGVTSGG